MIAETNIHDKSPERDIVNILAFVLDTSWITSKAMSKGLLLFWKATKGYNFVVSENAMREILIINLALYRFGKKTLS